MSWHGLSCNYGHLSVTTRRDHISCECCLLVLKEAPKPKWNRFCSTSKHDLITISCYILDPSCFSNIYIYIGEYMKNSRNSKKHYIQSVPKSRFYPGPGLRGECVEHHIPRRASARSKGTEGTEGSEGTEGDENPMVFMGKRCVFHWKIPWCYWENLTVFTGKSHGFSGKSKVFDWTVQCFYSKIQYYFFLESGGIFHCLDWFADGFRYPRDGSCCFLSPGNWYLRFSNALKSSGEIIVGHVDMNWG